MEIIAQIITKVFHFGTLSLTEEPARTATQKAVAYAKARGKLITCDPNLRLPLWKTHRRLPRSRCFGACTKRTW